MKKLSLRVTAQVLTLVYPLILNGFDPQFDPYLIASKVLLTVIKKPGLNDVSSILNQIMSSLQAG